MVFHVPGRLFAKGMVNYLCADVQRGHRIFIAWLTYLTHTEYCLECLILQRNSDFVHVFLCTAQLYVYSVADPALGQGGGARLGVNPPSIGPGFFFAQYIGFNFNTK
jgi:hypothetical protein